MYNEDIKKRFIEDAFNESSFKDATTIFNNFGKIEKKYNKDAYYIPYGELFDGLLTNINALSYGIYYNHMLYIKKYKQWCVLNQTFDEIVALNTEDITDEEMHKKYEEFLSSIIIRSSSEFYQYLDIMFQDEIENDFMSMDDFLKMFFLLLYNNFSESEIFALTIEDIHIVDNGVFIKCDNKMCKIEDANLQTLLKNRIENPRYGYFRGVNLICFELGEKLIDFGSEIKNAKRQISIIKSTKMRFAGAELQKINPNYKIILTANNLYVCGIIRQVKDYEEMNKCKVKKKELYTWFSKKETASSNKKRQIKTIYDIW